MNPWWTAIARTDEFGTAVQVSLYVDRGKDQREKILDHDIKIGNDIDVPDDELYVWASMTARSLMRYFEDLVIEQIRRRVGADTPAESHPPNSAGVSQ